MIMHRPPCYAYTVLLSLSYPPPRRLVPSPPVRLEQQSPRTLRARSVTHPLIRTDNRFWQAHSLRSLARSFARSPRIVSPVSPRGWKKVARFLLHCSSKLAALPSPRFIATHSVSANLQANCSSTTLRQTCTAGKKKKKKRKSGSALRFTQSRFDRHRFSFLASVPLGFFFFKRIDSRVSALCHLLSVVGSRKRGRACVCTCACVRVCVKNRTLREVIGIGERGGSSRVKEHFRLALRRTMDALDFHLVKRDSMGEGRGGDSFQLKYPRFF